MKMVNKKMAIFVHIHSLNIILFPKIKMSLISYVLKFFGIFLSEYLDYNNAFVKREQFIKELVLW